MGDRIKGTEGFGIMRAFGAVAILVGLYGFSLSAAALIDNPQEPSAKRPEWYAPAAAAAEQRPESTMAPRPGASFWTSTGPAVGASPAIAAVSVSGAGSFWDENAPRPVVNGSKLAGDPDRAAGRM